jgi:hypothetical protein
VRLFVFFPLPLKAGEDNLFFDHRYLNSTNHSSWDSWLSATELSQTDDIKLVVPDDENNLLWVIQYYGSYPGTLPNFSGVRGRAMVLGTSIDVGDAVWRPGGDLGHICPRANRAKSYVSLLTLRRAPIRN